MLDINILDIHQDTVKCPIRLDFLDTFLTVCTSHDFVPIETQPFAENGAIDGVILWNLSLRERSRQCDNEDLHLQLKLSTFQRERDQRVMNSFGYFDIRLVRPA